MLEKELVDGETRVQRLEAEASVVPPTRLEKLDAEVSQLKAKLAMMEAEQPRLSHQDRSMIAHIGALIAKGASKLSTVESVEGQSRSPFMAALIFEADAKRRCVEANPYPSTVGNHVS